MPVTVRAPRPSVSTSGASDVTLPATVIGFGGWGAYARSQIRTTQVAQAGMVARSRTPTHSSLVICRTLSFSGASLPNHPDARTEARQSEFATDCAAPQLTQYGTMCGLSRSSEAPRRSRYSTPVRRWGTGDPKERKRHSRGALHIVRAGVSQFECNGTPGTGRGPEVSAFPVWGVTLPA